MITFIHGTLVSQSRHTLKGAVLIVSVQGMGYEILTSQRTLSSHRLVEGEEIHVYTQLVVREDDMSLVGFLTREERDLFLILRSAGGVGVRVALALLSELSVSAIVQAVVSESFKPLTAAKGVGPKLAKKITLELKEKMSNWRKHTAYPETEGSEALSSPDSRVPGRMQDFLEAENVLLSLGYTSEEIQNSFQPIQEHPESLPESAEGILKEALRWLATV